MKLLLQAGVKVDAKNTDGQTALHHAARAGDIETIEVLLAAGANVSAQDEKGDTPLLAGAEATVTAQRRTQDKIRCGKQTPREVPQLLIVGPARTSTPILKRAGPRSPKPVCAATRSGWRSLLKAGAQVNAKCAQRLDPPPLRRRQEATPRSSRLLLAAGADPTVKN